MENLSFLIKNKNSSLILALKDGNQYKVNPGHYITDMVLVGKLSDEETFENTFLEDATVYVPVSEIKYFIAYNDTENTTQIDIDDRDLSFLSEMVENEKNFEQKPSSPVDQFIHEALKVAPLVKQDDGAFVWANAEDMQKQLDSIAKRMQAISDQLEQQ